MEANFCQDKTKLCYGKEKNYFMYFMLSIIDNI